jgi:hypothetical protein
MFKSRLAAAVFGAALTVGAQAQDVYDEATLLQAFADASADSSIEKIVFARNAHISLTQPAVFTGTQAIKLVGRGATIDGSEAGEFVLAENLEAVTEDGTLIFNTSAPVRIRNLSVVNSATRGVVVNVPEGAQGRDIRVVLNQVTIADSALYGLHVDDNADEFDDGDAGSAIGVNLRIVSSEFVGNGTGAIDFDGVRVDERGEGDITAFLLDTHIDRNGGDGMELDEAGDGDVAASLYYVTLNDNGFYNQEDLDDGFDIDEAGEGDLVLDMMDIEVNGNKDEGLDFDEAGDGDVVARLTRIYGNSNNDEALKIDEEDGGDINVRLKRVTAAANGDDGIQLTELGEGRIKGAMKKVTVTDSGKYGIKAEQWVEEDEDSPVEPAGSLKLRNITLSGNDKGDEVKVNNIELK